MLGDRLCADCGYNLTGQPVLRERHYQMLIVRCPECGAVAALQEYPLLGHWVSRWAAVLAAAWLLALVALLVITVAFVSLISIETAERSGDRLATQLETAFQASAVGQQLSNLRVSRRSPEYRKLEPEIEKWYRPDNISTILADQGGLGSLIDWSPIARSAVPAAIISFLLGSIWSVALLAQRLRGRLFFAAAIYAIIAVNMALAVMNWMTDLRATSSSVAIARMGPWVLAGMFLLSAVTFRIGQMCGRSLARTVVKALLPPRLRASLTFLWLADNLPPPRISS
jgi:hypothetical protein